MPFVANPPLVIGVDIFFESFNRGHINGQPVRLYSLDGPVLFDANGQEFLLRAEFYEPEPPHCRNPFYIPPDPPEKYPSFPDIFIQIPRPSNVAPTGAPVITPILLARPEHSQEILDFLASYNPGVAVAHLDTEHKSPHEKIYQGIIFDLVPEALSFIKPDHPVFLCTAAMADLYIIR